MTASDNSDDKLFLSHMEDLAEKADKGGYVSFSDFLDDRKQSLLAQAAGRLSVCYKEFGGYERAERVVAAFYPDYLEEELSTLWREELCLLKVTVADKRFLKKIPGHRDFLGALMGTGLKREKIGDILPCEDGAYVWVCRRIADFVKQELLSVGPAVVTVEEAEPDQMPPPAPGIRSVISVSSLRLDAVISRGFSLSRGESASLIKSGVVQINGAVCQNPDKAVSEGDKLTLRGKGRLTVGGIKGRSRSDRLQVEIETTAK